MLVSISSKSKLHWIFSALLEKKYIICVSNEILSEYAEIIERHMGSDVSNAVLATLSNLSNVVYITTYYQFRLLYDEDDNKFVDCAFAANAEYIVTHDKDFNILSEIEFPKVHIKNTEEFRIDLFGE